MVDSIVHTDPDDIFDKVTKQKTSVSLLPTIPMESEWLSILQTGSRILQIKFIQNPLG